MTDATLQTRADTLVDREVHACMSSLVATLAPAYFLIDGGRGAMPQLDAARDLAEQAFELASPVLDYEDAAREAGWSRVKHNGYFNPPLGHELRIVEYDNWEELCADNDIEPHECEVYEHWAVSPWLGDKLVAAGERVDQDFAGLCVWARTTTGQAISMDEVIQRIVSETGYASGA